MRQSRLEAKPPDSVLKAEACRHCKGAECQRRKAEGYRQHKVVGFTMWWAVNSRPCDFFIDEDDTVFVPELDAFMSIMTIDGQRLARWAGPTDAGAHAVWVDSHGDLYVNQNLEGQRLPKYRRVG